MSKFIVLYHAPASAAQQMADSTPEEMEQGMSLWYAWAEKCGAGLVDIGTPLAGGRRLSPDGSSQDSTREVAGFSILEAEDMDAAMAMLEGHPHLAWNGGCTIEVHQAMPLPGTS